MAFKNASRVFLNGLFWLIECLRNISNRIFVPGGEGGEGGRGRGVRWEGEGEGEGPETGMEDLSIKTRSQKIFQRQRIKLRGERANDSLVGTPLLIYPAPAGFIYMYS